MTESFNQLSEIFKFLSIIVTPFAVALSVFTYLWNARNRRIDNAIVYCDRFAKNVLPFYQKYKVDTLNIEKLNFHPGLTIHTVNGLSRFEGVSLSKEGLKQLRDLEVYSILNELDIISVAINKRALDVRTVKSIIGPLFCEAIEVYSPIILSIRSSNEYAFDNCLKTYKKWRKSYENGVESPLNTHPEDY